MNKKNIFLSAVIIGLSLVVCQAQALTTSQTLVRTRVIKEMDRKLSVLNVLMSRVDNSKKIASGEKSSLKLYLNNIVKDLTDLKEKINVETDADILKSNYESASEIYDVYTLFLPKVQIVITADRIKTISAMMATVGQKMQVNISQLPPGADLKELNSYLSDASAKIADAEAKADAAILEVTEVSSDSRDKNGTDPSVEILKSARTKIQVAQEDLITARKDMTTIMKLIKELSPDTTAVE